MFQSFQSTESQTQSILRMQAFMLRERDFDAIYSDIEIPCPVLSTQWLVEKEQLPQIGMVGMRKLMAFAQSSDVQQIIAQNERLGMCDHGTLLFASATYKLMQSTINNVAVRVSIDLEGVNFAVFDRYDILLHPLRISFDEQEEVIAQKLAGNGRDVPKWASEGIIPTNTMQYQHCPISPSLMKGTTNFFEPRAFFGRMLVECADQTVFLRYCASALARLKKQLITTR